MNDLELEPLPDDVLKALEPFAAPPPALPPGVAEGVLLKVKASAGLAAVAGGAAVSSTSAATAAKGGASVFLKVLPALTLTAGVGLGVAADRLVLRPNSVQERVVVKKVEVPVPVPTTEEPRPAPVPSPKKPTMPTVDTLGKERVVLDLARSALSAKDWNQALAAVASHEAQFPRGQLIEERETLAIQALVGAGRKDEARRRVSSFVVRFTDSPVRSSLEALVR